MSSTAFSLSRRVTKIAIPNTLLAIIIFFQAVLVTGIFSVLGFQIYFLHRLYPGVSIGGVEAGQMTRTEAQQLAMAQSAALLSQPITLTTEQGTFTFSAEELGARIDVAHTVNRAFAIGRQGSLLKDMRIQWETFKNPVNIVPIINFDTGPANSALMRLSNELNRPPKDAQVWLDGTTVRATAAAPGFMVDVENTRDAIRHAILTRNTTPITLVVHTADPAVSVVEPARQKLETLLSAPLVFTFEGREWSIAPETLAEMIIIAPKNGEVTVSFDEAPVAKYFFDLATEINRDAVDAWFQLNPVTYALTPIIPSQTGYRLDVAAAVEMMRQVWDNPTEHRLALPVATIEPAVSSEYPAQLGIKELVSSATTYFKGSSADRMQNIKVSAEKFNGVVIPPGEIFSFNKYVGDITAENGFVESLIIQGDRTAVGIGGGVCQVSTTAFRAALFGGFEIVERWAHGYRVSWYETGSVPGLDATIYTPDVDFKFRNDTDSYILVQTYTDLQVGTVTFAFYGTSPKRTVILSDPIESNRVPHGPDVIQVDPSLKPGEKRQIDWAKDGLDVTIYRTVKEGDTIIHEDTIFSRYRPWQNVYQVGPSTPSTEP